MAAPILMVLVLAFMFIGCGSSGGSRNRLAVPSAQVSAPSVDRPAGYFVDPLNVTISPGTAGTIGIP